MADKPIPDKGTQFDLGHIYPGLRFDFRQDHDHINQNLIVDNTSMKFEGPRITFPYYPRPNDEDSE